MLAIRFQVRIPLLHFSLLDGADENQSNFIKRVRDYTATTLFSLCVEEELSGYHQYCLGNMTFGNMTFLQKLTICGKKPVRVGLLLWLGMKSDLSHPMWGCYQRAASINLCHCGWCRFDFLYTAYSSELVFFLIMFAFPNRMWWELETMVRIQWDLPTQVQPPSVHGPPAPTVLPLLGIDRAAHTAQWEPVCPLRSEGSLW